MGLPWGRVWRGAVRCRNTNPAMRTMRMVAPARKTTWKESENMWPRHIADWHLFVLAGLLVFLVAAGLNLREMRRVSFEKCPLCGEVAK